MLTAYLWHVEALKLDSFWPNRVSAQQGGEGVHNLRGVLRNSCITSEKEGLTDAVRLVQWTHEEGCDRLAYY